VTSWDLRTAAEAVYDTDADPGRAAEVYTWAGHPVFQLARGTRRPMSSADDATTDATTVRAWWSATADAGVAIVLGAGIVVLDVYEACALAALATAEDAHGALPPTLTAATEDGRIVHYYFAAGVSSSRRVGPCLTVRGEGQYVPAPPTAIDGRGRLAWIDLSPPAPMPSWLADGAVRTSATRRRGAARPDPSVADAEEARARLLAPKVREIVAASPAGASVRAVRKALRVRHPVADRAIRIARADGLVERRPLPDAPGERLFAPGTLGTTEAALSDAMTSALGRGDLEAARVAWDALRRTCTVSS
jgi:hypothetical protein